MKVNKKSLLYGTVILTAANFIVRILGFIYRIFLSRMIGAQGMGVIQLIFPVYMITITLTATGIPVAVSRIIAQRKAIGDDLGIKRTLRIAITAIIIIGSIISLLVLLNVDMIATQILHEPRTHSALMVFFPCIIVTGLGAVLKGYFYGTKNIHPPAISEIVEQLIRIVFVLVLLVSFSDLNIEMYAVIVVLGMVIGEFTSLFYLHYHYHRHSKNACSSMRTPSKFALLKEVASIAAPVTFTRFISTLMMSLNAILIPQKLMSAGLSNSEAVGLFGIVSGMVMPLLFFPFTLISALSVIIIPNLSESVMLKNWSNIRDKISKSILLTCLTAFCCMGLLFPLGYPIGIVLYKEPAVGKYLGLLLWSLPFICLQHSLSSILNGLEKQNRAAMHFIIGGAIQLTCTYFLIPSLGIMGFVIGFMTSSILVTILNLWVIIPLTKLRIRWVAWFVKPACAAYAMALMIYVSYAFLNKNGISAALSMIFSTFVGLAMLSITLIIIGAMPSWLVKEVKKKVRR